MKNIFKLLTILFIIQSQITNAQFVFSGVIQYERKTNLKLQMKNEMEDKDGFYKEYIKQIPATVSSYYTLYFNEDQAYYKFDKHQELKGMFSSFMSQGAGKENKVYTNLKNNVYTAEKSYYDATFLVNDTLPRLQWKIEDEVRVIAGYTCRKATTTLFDSVVVVAFYSEDIIPRVGPETLNGLPGAILGIAIPRLYTTWMATAISLDTPNEKDIQPPSKGKKTGFQDMLQQVRKSSEGWGGNWGEFSVWSIGI